MIKKSFAVLGLGKFGRSVAEELAQIGAEVMVVDKNEDIVREMSDKVTCAVKADVCDVTTMKSLGLSNMDAVIVAITESIDSSIMATIIAKEAGVPFIIAKSKDYIHTKILEKVGADKIFIPEKDSGHRVARSLTEGKFIDFFELSDRIRIVEIPVKEEWVGKNLKELNLRKTSKINIIAIRNGRELNVNPDPDEALKANMTIIITADKRDLNKI